MNELLRSTEPNQIIDADTFAQKGDFKTGAAFVQPPSIGVDAGGRQRVSELTTLFDGKHLNADESDLWHGAGDGTAAFDTANNAMELSVTAGQWYVRQGNWFAPYFSGKSQMVESTFLDFAPQAGVIKRIGYFSSSKTSPHTAELDGYWLESNGDVSTDPATAIRLVIYNFGTEVEAIPLNQWTNYSDLKNYDWNKFTVCPSDFLWLGGNDLRQFISLAIGGFSEHTYEHAGNKDSVIFRSPNQPLRYEIRSSTGSGSFKFVCGQISTEGSNNESGKSAGVFNPTAITCNSVGTIYALMGGKKLSAYRNNAFKITDFGTINSATNDSGVLMLLKNPSLSSPLSYFNYGRAQVAFATNQTVTVDTTQGTDGYPIGSGNYAHVGRIVAAIPIGQEGSAKDIKENFMTWMCNAIDDTMAEYVLAYMPTTANQTQTGIVNFKVF